MTTIEIVAIVVTTGELKRMASRFVNCLVSAAIALSAFAAAQGMPTTTAASSMGHHVERLAKADAGSRYSALRRLRSEETLPDPVVEMVIDYLNDFRGDAPGNTVAGAAAELLAQHPDQAAPAIPQLLELLSKPDLYGYPADSAARALAEINRVRVEDYVSTLSAEHRYALVLKMKGVLDSASGSYRVWGIASEIIAMLGQDASIAITVLKDKMGHAEKRKNDNPHAAYLWNRAGAALAIIEKGLKLGGAAYKSSMDRADASIGQLSAYLTSGRRFAVALELVADKAQKAGVDTIYILRAKDVVPAETFRTFPPIIRLIEYFGYVYVLPIENKRYIQLPNKRTVLLNEAAKRIYQQYHFPTVDPPYIPLTSRFAFLEAGATGTHILNEALQEIGIEGGYSENRLYEFWPASLWGEGRELPGVIDASEALTTIGIVVQHGKVVGRIGNDRQ